MKNRYKQAVDNKKRSPISPQMRHRLREGLFLICVACSVFLFVSLISYHANDPGWSSTGLGHKVANWGGRVGAWLADIFLSLFGMVAYLFPFLMILSSWLSVQEPLTVIKKSREWMIKLIGWLFLIASCCCLVSFYFKTKSPLPAASGGILGDVLGKAAALLFNETGSTLIFITTLLCGITLVTGLSWLWVIETVGAWASKAADYLCIQIKKLSLPKVKLLPKKEPSVEVIKKVLREEPPILPEKVAPPVIIAKPVVVPKLEPPREKKKIEVDTGIRLAPGTLPPLTLLNQSSPLADKAFTNITFEELSQLVEQRLADFGVDVKVVAVHPGPVITRFELDLAPGIKVSKITGLAKDIARSLSTVSVRIVEVIPGKSVIGLEIPNENRETVMLREILESQRYVQSRSPVSLVLGKDISGNPVVVDLAKMPHMLVAGTTGSGKSVSLNAMLLSMLFKATPDQLRLILIDPKMLELSVYDGIPHLLTPVITDMKDASNALRWCVAEMDKRYRLMASLGVRNLASYNQKVLDAAKSGQPLLMPGVLVTDEASAKTQLEPLPIIVVVADELADMMMVVGKKVEDLIARIAQKARAAGIHLILATQRPSVDVITGLIKANIPTRVAFQVSSRIDSRTILDQQGAEQLLGHGDMLYLPPGAGVPIRVHGAYVADEEVHRVVAAWRTGGEPEYIYEVTDEVVDNNSGSEGQGSGEQDSLYDEAVKIVTESRRASISLVQRRLRIGYNRAARMMEEMEIAGVVSSMDNSGTREVLAAVPPHGLREDMMKHTLAKIFIYMAGQFLFTGAYAADATNLSTLLDAVHAMKADFKQTVYDNHHKAIQVSFGRMMMQRPGKFRWEVLKPMPQIIIANQTKLWIYDPDLEQVSIRSLQKAAGETPALLLSNVNSTLNTEYTVTTMTKNNPGWQWYQLVPRKTDNMFAAIQMGFMGNQIHEMDLKDQLGHTTKIEYKNIQTNMALDNSLFNFKPPAHVDVIDETKKT